MRQSTQYLVHFLKNHFLYQNVKNQSIKTVVYGGFTCSACLLDFAQTLQPNDEGKRRSKLFRVHISFFEEKVEGLFKDFQGQISHFSRTPFNAKKSLESVFFGSSPTWAILSWRSFCVYSFLPLENLKGWIKLALKFKDFSAPTTIIFQGLSRTFKVCANPDCYNWLIIGSEAPNVNFPKISVWKTI